MLKKLSIFFLIFFAALTPAFLSFAAYCNTHAYKDCSGSIVFWYNSCSQMEDMVENCSNYGLDCKYGQCISASSVYTKHSLLGCYKGSIYWYDSLRQPSDFYMSCSDSNTCTVDGCINAKCFITLKCDGTTCKPGSGDYIKHCGSKSQQTGQVSECGNNQCERSLGETESSCPSDCQEQTVPSVQNLSIEFFTKSNPETLQWDKSLQIKQNSTAYFMITVANNSELQADNVIVSATIPQEIPYLGNLKIDGNLASGDIVSGIDIGSVLPNAKKTITFEGKTQTFNLQGSKKATAFLNSAQVPQSDLITINFDGNVSQVEKKGIGLASISSAIVDFLNRWYMWLAAGFILIFLFAIIFKRLSSDA